MSTFFLFLPFFALFTFLLLTRFTSGTTFVWNKFYFFNNFYVNLFYIPSVVVASVSEPFPFLPFFFFPPLPEISGSDKGPTVSVKFDIVPSTGDSSPSSFTSSLDFFPEGISSGFSTGGVGSSGISSGGSSMSVSTPSSVVSPKYIYLIM